MNILIGYSETELENSLVSSIEKENILSSIHDKLTMRGLRVSKLEKKYDIDEHIWIRDNFFVLGGECFLCKMTKCDTLKHDREPEQVNITTYLETKYDNLTQIPFPIEGGDVLFAKNDVFVGIGKRTCIESFEFLKRRFNNYRFHKVHHQDLHLDCCFAVLGNTIMFNGSKVLVDDINMIKCNSGDSYEFLDIDTVDDGNLNTNFITHDNVIFHGMISNDMLSLFNSKGYEVEQIDNLNSMYAEGGGIRCLTQFY